MSPVIDRLIGALNAHDLDAAADLFHPDYRSEQPAHPERTFVGQAQMRANWAAMFAGVPDIHVEVRRRVADADTTWLEWEWTGTGMSGEPFEVRGVCLFQVDDGSIVAGRLYMESVERDGDIVSAVRDLSGSTPARAPR